MKILVIIPTYDERENIEIIIPKILDIGPYEILVVDDNSPDGTSDAVKALKSKSSRIHIIDRPGKLGLGTAYVEGYRWALKNGYDKVVQMDADLSHNPDDIPSLVSQSSDNDLVIGSRYKSGVNVVNWPMSRLILSYLANIYAKLVIGYNVKDFTGGFKCINSSVLKAIDIDNIKSEGYAFQIEVNFEAISNGFNFLEVPIVFHDRVIGKSKLNRGIIWEAIWKVPALRLKRIIRFFK
tara:strand:- start:827 stop:1540 length:714 start_codon:yes stop_codon:yes gene_type:complete